MTYTYCEMIIVISLITIHHHIGTRRKKEKTYISLWWELLGFYCLKNFHICHAAVLTIVIMLYIISLILIYSITGTLNLLIILLQFSFLLLPTSYNHKSDLLFYEFVFRFHICEIIQYLSLSDLFHLPWCPQGPSMLLHMAGFPYFLRLNNIPLCVGMCMHVHVHHNIFIHSSG